MAVAVSLRGREGGGTAELGDEVQNCLRASSGGGDKPHVLAPVVPLQEVVKRTGVSTDDPRAGIGIGHEGDPMFTLQAGAQHGVGTAMAVRRLTPVECERLQGFPDNWTLIPTGKKKKLDADELARLRAMTHEQLAAIFEVDPTTFSGCTDEELQRLAADGPRYKALGNSMAVPVMRWIGKRISEHLA